MSYNGQSVEEIAAEIKSHIDDHRVRAAENAARIDEIEQKLARRGGGDGTHVGASLGQQFVDAKGAGLASMTRGDRASLEVKASLTSLTTDAAGSVGDLIVPQADTATTLPRRRLTIRNLLTVVNATSGSVEYPKQTGRTNSAAPVAEGATKPESDIKFDLETVPMRVIAHWMKASRQVLEDVPQLRSIIDDELLYGLSLVEEAQLLFGDGTGQNLEGMAALATAYASPISPDPTENEIDTIALAILQASLTDIPPDGVVLHPSDWWRMRLLKDGEGKYILGDPGVVAEPRLFGLPVVTTQAMTVDKFLVGAFKAQTLYDRWSARVEVGFVNDDFTKNLVTVLGEERIGFAAKRPEALIYGDFGNVA
ncbi:MAG: phage major capsid protein [Alphaproteobacteria bacterium]|nr:MAG: phage major capsid protein [Alphaproteobacteria bacterium]